MAVGPQQYLDSKKERLKKAEEKIDKHLSEEISRFEKIVTVSTKGLNITSSEFDMFLRAKYYTAGWAAVVWKHDPRDEDWIEFTLPQHLTKE